MDWDRLPASRRWPKVERLFAQYVRDEVIPFSATEPARLTAAGIDGTRLRSVAQLTSLVPVDPEALDGVAAVLRPTPEGLAHSPHRLRWWWSGVTRRRGALVEEVLDPRYRAIHFDEHVDLLVASSAADLDRLADLGRRWLSIAGVHPDDALVGLLAARADLAFWQLTLGCRRGGVPAMHLGNDASAAEVAPYGPTVLAGPVVALRRVASEAAVDGSDLGAVRLVLVTGWLPSGDRVDLGARFPGAAVRAAWAPPGVRALWAECTAGGLHTWPDTELIEVLDAAGRPTVEAGTVVWSPIGWRGTVALRLRTGARARLVDVPCPCGATSPRLEVLDPRPVAGGSATLEASIGELLDVEPLVAAWFAHLDDGVLSVRVAPVRGARATVATDLARLGAALGADRVVLERPSVLRSRIEAAGGCRVVDRSR